MIRAVGRLPRGAVAAAGMRFRAVVMTAIAVLAGIRVLRAPPEPAAGSAGI